MPAYILSLSFPERGRDMPFSFPAHGVITGSGNGSMGALGTSTCQEARNQCQHFYENNLSLLLFVRNHQDLDGNWTVSLNQDLAFYVHPGRMAMKQRTTKVVVKKKWVAHHIFLAKEPCRKWNILNEYLYAHCSQCAGVWWAHQRVYLGKIILHSFTGFVIFWNQEDLRI